MIPWRQHRPTWRRWQRKPWRPRQCWIKIIIMDHTSGPTSNLEACETVSWTLSGSKQLENKLTRRPCWFLELRNRFLVPFLYFRFINLLKIWLSVSILYHFNDSLAGLFFYLPSTFLSLGTIFDKLNTLWTADFFLLICSVVMKWWA